MPTRPSSPASGGPTPAPIPVIVVPVPVPVPDAGASARTSPEPRPFEPRPFESQPQSNTQAAGAAGRIRATPPAPSRSARRCTSSSATARSCRAPSTRPRRRWATASTSTRTAKDAAEPADHDQRPAALDLQQSRPRQRERWPRRLDARDAGQASGGDVGLGAGGRRPVEHRHHLVPLTSGRHLSKPPADFGGPGLLGSEGRISTPPPEAVRWPSGSWWSTTTRTS